MRGAVQALLGEPGLDRRTRQARADSLLLYGEVFGRAKGFDSAVRHPRDLDEKWSAFPRISPL